MWKHVLRAGDGSGALLAWPKAPSCCKYCEDGDSHLCTPLGHLEKPIRIKLDKLNLPINSLLVCPENMETAGYGEVGVLHYSRQQLGVGSWGPPRLDHIINFCRELHDVLSSGRTAAVWSSQHPGAIAYCLVLVGAYLVLQRNMTAAQAARILPKSDCERFPKPWSNLAEYRKSSVTVLGCLRSLEAASNLTCFNLHTFNVKQFQENLQLWDASVSLRTKIGDGGSKPLELTFWAIADPVTTVSEPTFRPDVPHHGFTPDYNCDRQWTRCVSEGCNDVILTPDYNGDQRFARCISEGGPGVAPKTVSTKTVSRFPPKPNSKEPDNTKPRVQNTWLSHVRMKRWSSQTTQGTCFNALLDKCKTAQTLPQFASWLKEIQCRLLVRLNGQNEPNLPPCGSYGDYFQQCGIACLNIAFPDGTCPSIAIVEAFIAAVEDVKRQLYAEGTSGSIVVHCSAGLGRTMTLLGAYAREFDLMGSGAWAGWARMCRPGSIQTYCQEEYFQSRTDGSACFCLPTSKSVL